MMGYPNNQLTTEYWFPWYDNLSMASWVLIANPGTNVAHAHVSVYIGGNLMNVDPYDIAPGDRVTPNYTALDGPVHVVSDIPVITSERVHTGQGFVNEMMGYPNDRLTTEYWFPWYDNLSMSSWVLIGNPSATADANVRCLRWRQLGGQLHDPGQWSRDAHIQCVGWSGAHRQHHPHHRERARAYRAGFCQRNDGLPERPADHGVLVPLVRQPEHVLLGLDRKAIEESGALHYELTTST